MPELADFQLAFAAAIERTGHKGALERQPGFAVYRNTTPSALIEVLRASYPVVRQLLGDEAFDGTAFEFTRAHPPGHAILLDYGAGFARFLAGQPWVAEELPYLPDVAEVERLRAEALNAPDAPALSLSDSSRLGTDAWPTLRLPLHPAARFAWLRTPAVTIWEAHQRDDFDNLAPDWRAEGVLFTRPADAVHITRIDAAAHRFLVGLKLGEPAGRAAAAITALYPDADIAGLYALLTQQGAFARPPALERPH